MLRDRILALKKLMAIVAYHDEVTNISVVLPRSESVIPILGVMHYCFAG